MRTHNLPHTDLTVSCLAYGCASLGGARLGPVSADVRDSAPRLIGAACERGINFFDLADIYAGGKSETVFGEVLKRSPELRERLVIQSKCGIRFQDDPAPGVPFRIDLSRAHIVASVEGSLRRLQTDRLDILLLHMPDALLEPHEVAEAFDHLQTSGKVRYFGVSNHTPAQIALLRTAVRQPLVTNQVHLGLAHPYLIAEGLEANRDDSTRLLHGFASSDSTLDYCRVHSMRIQAYAPLRGASIIEKPAMLASPDQCGPKAKQLSLVLTEIARSKGVTPSAVALAWLLRHPAGIIPVIGTTNPDHLVDNCAAVNVTLSREEWYLLFVTGADVPSMRLIGIRSP